MRKIVIKIEYKPIDSRSGLFKCPGHDYASVLSAYLARIGCITVSNPGSEIIYFKADKGMDARQVTDSVYFVAPLFTIWLYVRASWLRRNFWIMWGIAWGVFEMINALDNLMGRRVLPAVCCWCAGLLIFMISFSNYAMWAADEAEARADMGEKCAKELLDGPTGRISEETKGSGSRDT